MAKMAKTRGNVTLEEELANMYEIAAGMPSRGMQQFFRAVMLESLRQQYGSEPVTLAVQTWEENLKAGEA